MAKKKTAPRRVPRTATPRMYGDGKPTQRTPQTDVPRTSASRPNGVVTRAAAGRVHSTVPLSQEYRYVPGDLRRLGLLAAGIFVVMIVLGVIVR
jgi:hypothetical protein